MPPLAAGAMRITYNGKLSDWTLAALAAVPHKTITVYNEHTKANETYSGVPLIDLVTKLGVASQPHGKDLAIYLEAIGTDGYKAVYSVGEVNPDVHDGTVLVADSEDGKPIGADGPLKLVAYRREASGTLGAQPGGRAGSDGGIRKQLKRGLVV